MIQLPEGFITCHVENFLRSDKADPPAPRRRERSWDFCFNHFQTHPEPAQAMELSCLHLGYYLASWGMLRGSGFLFSHTNLLHYQAAVWVIEEFNPALGGLDLHLLAESDAQENLYEAWHRLRLALLPEGGRSLVLVSKVMMGVWGCLPSFDTYFTATFRELARTSPPRPSFRSATRAELNFLAAFYGTHSREIDELARSSTTIDVLTGQPTGRHMTRAKIVDIFGFQCAYTGSVHVPSAASAFPPCE